MTDLPTPNSVPTLRDAPATLPWYARALDAVSLATAAVAISALVFGGFRVRFDTVRVSVQSPWRALGLLAVVLLVRHAVYRHEHVGARLARAWRRWRSDEAVRAALRALVFVRLPIILAAYFAVVITGYPMGREPPFRASKNEFLNLPARWDAGWYLGIATDGYHPASRANVQQNIAFFPAYPMLMRVGGTLLGARAPNVEGGPENFVQVTERANERTLLAGWLLSLGATFLALVYLWRFANETLGPRAPAGAVLLISAYPFAYFFGAVYTEGLFLLGTVATVYHFRRGEHLSASAWGLLVGLTRPNGCLLSVPLALMALQRSYLPGTLAAGDPAPRPGFPAFAKSILVAAMPGIGMVIYTAWLWTITGQPIAWMQAHQAWGRSYQSVGALLGDRVETISVLGLYEYSRMAPVEFLYVVSLVACLATLWPVGRRLGWSYVVLVLITVLPPLFAGGFLSMGRITSTLFPVFVYVGWRIPEARQPQVALFGVALQGMLAALFFSWHPVF